METLGVAVIGVGRWGSVLLRVLSDLDKCRVVMIHDGSHERAEEIAATLPGVAVASSFDDVITNKKVQAVLLATPPETHSQLARQVLEVGKHVFVEKPMATSLADALALERFALRSGCLAMAGHLLRYHGGVAALRQIIADGQLGHIEWALSRRIGWRASDRCGPWWSLAPHDLSVLRGVLAVEPDQIAATCCLPGAGTRSAISKVWRGGSQPPPSMRCPVRVIAAAAFPGPTSALIDVGLLDASKMRRVILVGRRNMARFEDGVDGGLWVRPVRQALDVAPLPPDGGALTFDGANQCIEAIETAAKGDGWTQLEMNWPDALHTELQQFIAACQNPRLARVEMDDALAIMRALEVGARSMREGGRTLAVPKAARAAFSESESALGIL